MMFSQNDKIGDFTGSKNQDSSRYTTMVTRLLKNFCKLFSVDFAVVSISARLSEKIKNSHNFSQPVSRISQNI